MNWIRFLALSAITGLAEAGPIYMLTDLGTLGGSSATATSVNNSGQVTGWATNPYGYVHVFIASASGMTDLTRNSSASSGSGAVINDLGVVAGTQYINGQAYASIWNNGAASEIAGAGSYGNAINDNGQVAGMVTNQNGQGEAFVTQNGTVIDLGMFAGGSWSSAYALNNEGQVAGYGLTSGGAFRGFIWSPQTGYTALGTLGGANSYAMAINDQGQVAGSSQLSNGYMHAFLADGTLLMDLGTLGGASSYAYGINDEGVVVGYSLMADGSSHGFLYEDGVMYDINSLLSAAPGWTITGLYGINASGQVVGTGILDGVEHAVLLTDPPAPQSPGGGLSTSLALVAVVPEPAAWIGVASGLAALLLVQMIRQRL